MAFTLHLYCTHENRGVQAVRGFTRHIGNAGFSLIELLTAIAIAVILIGVAMPSFLSMIQRSRIDGGARQVLYEIRSAQSYAISRGGVFGFHWGGDPIPTGRLNSEYRIVRDRNPPLPPCSFPLVGDPQDGTDVIRTWWDLARDYPGVTIQSVQDANNITIGGVMFNSRGASVNTCDPVAFPLTINIADTSGALRTLQVQRAGRVVIQ